MRKIFGILSGVLSGLYIPLCYGADKFEVLPDLPEPLAAAQASSVSTADASDILTAQTIGQEPNFLSMIFSLVFVIILIYATGILYTKLNKFGAKALKTQSGDRKSSQVSVISTTPLGQNKTLHVVELDGKRMLLGASSGSIQLLKDLGSVSSCAIEEGEYSKIEIPNIRIPRIEIPKIEIPGFTRVISKTKDIKEEKISEETSPEESDKFEFSEIYEENPDGIIDKLFHTEAENEPVENEHKVNPDEFALYKKYL